MRVCISRELEGSRFIWDLPVLSLLVGSSEEAPVREHPSARTLVAAKTARASTSDSYDVAHFITVVD